MKTQTPKGEYMFTNLEIIQVVELAALSKAPFDGNMETNLEIGFGVNYSERPDRDLNVIAVPFSIKATAASSKTGSEPALTAICRLVGVWSAPKGLSPDVNELRGQAEKHAVPILYLSGRQHLSDVLSKLGARIDQWGWMPGGSSVGAEGRVLSAKQKSKAPRKPGRKSAR